MTVLEALASYSYSVIALDAADPPNASDPATLSVTLPTPPDTQAPEAPTGLITTLVESGQVTLQWTASSSDAEPDFVGYRLYRQGLLVDSTTALNYTDDTVSAETTYLYEVVAYDNATPANESSPATLSVTTPVAPDTQAHRSAHRVDHHARRIGTGYPPMDCLEQ